MGTTIKIYYVDRSEETTWKLLPNKLFIVEDIANYLATNFDCYTLTNFQYQKNKLEMGINVEFSQIYSQPLVNNPFKYVSIQNENESIYYYFVKEVVWRSKSCVRLELVMDVLNTFEEGVDYNFSPATKINREHKDRFIIDSVKRFLHISFDDYNVITSDPPQEDVPCDIKNGDTILFSGTLDHLIEESGIYTGAVFEIPEDDTRSDEEILSEFDNWEEGDTFEIIDEDMFIMEFYFDEVPFTYSNKPYITRTGLVYRNIDKTPENINPILVCDSDIDENMRNTKSLLRCDWFLLYRNQNDPSDSLVNPVECYLIPSEEIKTAYGYIANGRIIPSWLESGKFYYFQVSGTTTYTLSDGTTISDSDASHKTTMILSKIEDKISVQVVQAIYNSTVYMIYNLSTDYISISAVPVNYNELSYFMQTSYANYYTSITYPNTFNNSGTENILDDISKLDRTDSKNIKLIKLPYCPYDFSISSNAIQVDPNWDYVSLSQSLGGNINCLKLKYLDTELKGKIESHTGTNALGDLLYTTLQSLNPNLETLMDFSNRNMESKLYNSEFYSPTYYYDSFAFKIELEKCYMYYYLNNPSELNKTKINFIMTRTINSKFMFEFENYHIDTSESNYSRFMPIARNNEEVLYNVPYINYIRNGYQYDVKNKNISNISNAIGVGLSAASIGVSLALPSAPLKVAGVVASVVSMAMSVKNAVVSAVNNENSLKQKIAQTQNQTSSVAGSDDVDLMSVYAENRLKYLEYAPRSDFEDLIFKLFFYAGYKSERMGIPTHDNRVGFDYLECEAAFVGTCSIPSDCLEELINSFKNGVTYIHKRNTETGKWDLEQRFENWERMLFE